jgi:uncharacterized protein (DUF1697 family)
MPAYVALIRAIGPVTHALMKMAALRAACEDAGLSDVATVGNTGNIVFRSNKGADAARRLVQDIVTGFGLGPAQEVFVRTPGDMAAVIAANPFPDAALERPADLGVCSFHALPDWTPIRDWPGPEKLAMVGAHLVVDYPSSTASSRLNIEKLLGARMTQRNWRVFAGLSEKATLLAG